MIERHSHHHLSGMKRIFSLTIILAALLPTLSQAAMPPYSVATKFQESEQQGRKREFMNQRNAFFILELELEKEYYYKFKRVLPMRKVMALKVAERKFARLFLKSSYD